MPSDCSSWLTQGAFVSIIGVRALAMIPQIYFWATIWTADNERVAAVNLPYFGDRCAANIELLEQGATGGEGLQGVIPDNSQSTEVEDAQTRQLLEHRDDPILAGKGGHVGEDNLLQEGAVSGKAREARISHQLLRPSQIQRGQQGELTG